MVATRRDLTELALLAVAFVATAERVLALRTRTITDTASGIVDFEARVHPVLIAVQAAGAGAVLAAVLLTAKRGPSRRITRIGIAGTVVYLALWLAPGLMDTTPVSGMPG